MIGEMLTDNSIFQGLIDRRELRFARNAHQVGIAGIAIGSGLFGHLNPIRPLDFERRQRQK